MDWRAPDFWIMTFTGVLTLATVLLWVATVGLYRIGKSQSADLKRSIAAAEMSAQAAMAQVQLAERQLLATQRPQLVLTPIGLSVMVQKKGLSSTEVVANIVIRNAGSQPAFINSCYVQIEPRGRPFQLPTADDTTFQWIWCVTDVEDGHFLGVGSEVTATSVRHVDDPDNDLGERLRRFMLALYVVVLIDYSDNLGVRRRLGTTFGHDVIDEKMVRLTEPGFTFDRVIENDASLPARIGPAETVAKAGPTDHG